MVVDWDRISHITKVDPAKPLPDDLAVLSGTDLVLVGGSDNVTAENTTEAIAQIRNTVDELPVLQEPYRADHVSRETFDRVDGIAVPAVYNGNREHFLEKHLDFFTDLGSTPASVRGAGLPVVGDMIERRGREAISELAQHIIGEGYVIQNPDSRAAEVSGAAEPFSREEVAGAALATEAFYRFPIFYIEYSGTYGGTADVQAAAPHLDDTILLYGGGITSRDQTMDILEAGADAVVVGNCFHDDVAQYRDTFPAPGA